MNHLHNVWISFALGLATGGVLHAAPKMESIRVASDGVSFAQGDGKKFIAWGFNYDRDAQGRLLEDYWADEWSTVEADFQEMKALGANVVRIHLQLGKFMAAPDRADEASLERLAQLVKLAERTGLYLKLTGLGCYHKQDVPKWYDPLPEPDRWAVQARFWEHIARVGAPSPAIFGYDLMNEPILPGREKETDWLGGEFGGKYFVQRIALDLAGRTREEVAKAWVTKMADAIRRHDTRHMITVGVIPWALVFPGAKPLFYSPEVAEKLDFVSVHFYPEQGEIDKALRALSVYEVGKPLVIGEVFPLKCGMDELDEFITRSEEIADGWIGFYWGKTIEDYRKENGSIGDAITRAWLEYFQRRTAAASR
jgi:hypothetical protein